MDALHTIGVVLEHGIFVGYDQLVKEIYRIYASQLEDIEELDPRFHLAITMQDIFDSIQSKSIEQFPSIILLLEEIHKTQLLTRPVTEEVAYGRDVVYWKLIVGLKLKIVYDRIRIKHATALSRILKYFPENKTNFSECSDLNTTLQEVHKNTRIKLLKLHACSRARANYYPKEYHKQYGAKFMNRLLDLVVKFKRNYLLTTNPTLLQQILNSEPSIREVIDMDSTLSMLLILKRVENINEGILVDVVRAVTGFLEARKSLKQIEVYIAEKSREQESQQGESSSDSRELLGGKKSEKGAQPKRKRSGSHDQTSDSSAKKQKLEENSNDRASHRGSPTKIKSLSPVLQSPEQQPGDLIKKEHNIKECSVVLVNLDLEEFREEFSFR